MDDTPENTSGLGKNSTIPPAIKGWNWGAFLLHWIWGIFNNTFIAFLTWVPIFGWIFMLVLGVKGNEWAWQNKTWRDIEHFKNTQKKWAVAGVIAYLFFILFFVAIFSFVGGIMKDTDVYKMSFHAIQNNPEVVEMIGIPIEAGFFVSGNINTGGATEGEASIQYTITGPKGEGETYVVASKKRGKWIMHELGVYIKDNDKSILIITSP
jgi:hypothetical protein